MDQTKKVLRSIQTLFPYLQDLRYLLKSFLMKVGKKPVENDFKALNLFKPSADQVFVDAGANRGLTVLSMLLFDKFENKVIGFEPNPLVFNKAQSNYFIRNNRRVSIYNFGLGEHDEELVLFVPLYRKWMFDGLSSFHYESAKNWLTHRLWRFDPKKLTIRELHCQVRRLDDFQLNPYFIL